MTCKNYILTYYQQIVDGTVCVGQWIRIVYEIIIKGLDNKSFFYNHKKAQAALFWRGRTAARSKS